MTIDFDYENFHSGFCALIGKPNAGKSTLINQVLGQKIAAVSPRPQTTRKRQLGIHTTETMQIVFVDTPGVHLPKHKLGTFMMDVVQQALVEVDVILWMVDLSSDPEKEDKIIAKQLADLHKAPPVLMIGNKSDAVKSEQQKIERINAYKKLAPQAQQITISAKNKENFEVLLDQILQNLPPGPPLYDPEQITDLYMRDIAADLIREAALYHLKEEIPHSIAVRMDEYKERNQNLDFISATLLLERESHKGIVIGKGGSMLKKIGQSARQQIEAMSGKKVYLELRAKVNRDWMNNPNTLHWLGYQRKKN
ncbi:MAG: GTPase Era [Anaerolineaceae bacterium]|nr:GTPase Era [Anaerolineaceae bacterium]